MKIEFINKITEFFADKHTRRQVLFIVALLIFISLVLFSDYGLLNTVKLQNRRADINNSHQEEMSLTDSLKRHIKQLKYDTLFIERVAREKYGLVKPGEKIFVIEEEE